LFTVPGFNRQEKNGGGGGGVGEKTRGRGTRHLNEHRQSPKKNKRERGTNDDTLYAKKKRKVDTPHSYFRLWSHR